MARRTKEAPGRVTPKGASSAARPGAASGRYTAPIPIELRQSPKWVPILMLAFFGIGVLMIVLNYMGVLPGSASNGYLIGGIVLIIFGFVVSTQYR